MESYEKEWLAGQPVLRAIMHMVGLFDRPASGDCLKALRAKPMIEGLTDEIVKLDDSEWQRAVARLREVRFLATAGPDDPTRSTPIRWCANGSASGCGRRTSRHGKPPMAGFTSTCATRPRKARRRRSKTSRRSIRPSPMAAAPAATRRRWTRFTGPHLPARPDGTLEFYASKKLGAIGSDLAAVSWFFDKPYETPVAALAPSDQAWVLTEAALRCARRGGSPRRCRPRARRCGWLRRAGLAQRRRPRLQPQRGRAARRGGRGRRGDGETIRRARRPRRR